MAGFPCAAYQTFRGAIRELVDQTAPSIGELVSHQTQEALLLTSWYLEDRMVLSPQMSPKALCVA